MDVATFDRLLTAEGSSALATAAELRPTTTSYPACADRLAKHFPVALARAALDAVMLREKARAKFSRADDMYFTREALEVATGEAVARHRAGRFGRFGTVADLCCGIGGDAIGLGLAGCGFAAVDRDPLKVRMAEANAAAYGLAGRFVCGDVLADPLPDADAAFADPHRRPGGRRTLKVNDCEPPLDALLARLPAGHPFGVKLAPGVPWDDLHRYGAEAEFVSLDGELKECVLWFGPLKASRVRATVLPGPHMLIVDGPIPAAEVAPPGAVLYDPDPAVTRSRLVGVLAAELGARQIDPAVAFLSSDTLLSTPFAVAYRVGEVMPFHAKRVGERLRSLGVGRVTIVKRGSSLDADEVLRKWKLRGEEHRAVILTRSLGQAVAIIAERVGNSCGPVTP